MQGLQLQGKGNISIEADSDEIWVNSEEELPSIWEY